MIHLIYYQDSTKKDHLMTALCEFLEKILLDYKKNNFDVNLVLCSNQFIQSLNRQYRRINAPTDVLSFPMEENPENDEAPFFEEDLDDEEQKNLGDIIISAEKALEQAREYGVTEEEELVRLAVHGILHLLGFDHEKSKEEEKKMFKKQDEYLNEFLKKYSH